MESGGVALWAPPATLTSQHDSPPRPLTMDALRRAKQDIEGQPAMGRLPTPELPFVLQLAGRTYVCDSLRAWSEAIDDAMSRALRRTNTREAGYGPAQP